MRPAVFAATALIVTVLAVACDSRPDRTASDASDSVLVSNDEGLAVDSAAVDDATPNEGAEATPDGGEVWRPLAVPTPADPDTYPLVILNPHGVTVVVLADGGAGEVLLDTIAAGDSARVKLLIAADSVSLRAVGADGTAGTPERIPLEREREARWDVRLP